MVDRGAIEFEAQGVKYTLLLGTNAMADYEKLSKADGEVENVLQAAVLLQSATTPEKAGALVTRIRRLFQCGLRPRVDEDTAGDIMDALGGPVASAAYLNRALDGAFNGLAPGESENPRNASKKTR